MKKTIKTFALVLVIAMLSMLTGCGGNTTPPATSAPKQPSPTPTPIATENLEDKMQNKVNITIQMQDGGVMKAELYPDIAPITVANFTKLINEHFFDGLIFHRIIKDFMIQGGGFDANNQEKDTASIKGEFTSNGFKNDLKHTRGVLSMARTQVPDSASSQFFIMHDAAPSLDNQYAAFGKLTDGLDVLDKIATTKTTTLSNVFADYPGTPQVIKTITIDK